MSLQIPPAPINELTDALKDSSQFVYLVVDTQDSRAWKLALSLQRDLPKLYPARIEDSSIASPWITAAGAIAVTFDSAGKPLRQLSRSEAEDRIVVARALADAMES